MHLRFPLTFISLSLLLIRAIIITFFKLICELVFRGKFLLKLLMFLPEGFKFWAHVLQYLFYFGFLFSGQLLVLLDVFGVEICEALL